MARVTHVKACRVAQKCGKCRKVIKVGQPYMWWKFRWGGKYSRCAEHPPTAADLTQSEHWGTVFTIQDQLMGITDHDDVTEVIGEIESLAGDTEGKLSNMPEGLQEGDTGVLLQERVDALNDWAERLQVYTDEDAFELEEARGEDYEGE